MPAKKGKKKKSKHQSVKLAEQLVPSEDLSQVAHKKTDFSDVLSASLFSQKEENPGEKKVKSIDLPSKLKQVKGKKLSPHALKSKKRRDRARNRKPSSNVSCGLYLSCAGLLIGGGAPSVVALCAAGSTELTPPVQTNYNVDIAERICDASKSCNNLLLRYSSK